VTVVQRSAPAPIRAPSHLEPQPAERVAQPLCEGRVHGKAGQLDLLGDELLRHLGVHARHDHVGPEEPDGSDDGAEAARRRPVERGYARE
jgi:hypothetical protein